MMKMMSALLLALITALALTPLQQLSQALEISEMRNFTAKFNISCILVFGDSSVDTGNNNVLSTTMKSNFLPYGKSFFGHPTGRFSNGRLAIDFIAEGIGYEKLVPAFLDPNLKPVNLLHGVSFASAASGYDDLTANLSSVLSVLQQLKYFMHYKIHVAQLVGRKKAEYVIRNAIVVISMGTNDFLQNYYLEPTRSKQFTIEGYQNFLVDSFLEDVKTMHKLGVRRLAVVGVPPLGCMPLFRTILDQTTCVDRLNQVAYSFNSKIKGALVSLKTKLGLKTAFVDAYAILNDAINNPKKYGLTETSKGCCGTGEIEYGDSCKGLSTCKDPSKYVFWDAVHPTEKMYKIIADEAIKSVEEAISS